MGRRCRSRRTFRRIAMNVHVPPSDRALPSANTQSSRQATAANQGCSRGTPDSSASRHIRGWTGVLKKRILGEPTRLADGLGGQGFPVQSGFAPYDWIPRFAFQLVPPFPGRAKRIANSALLTHASATAFATDKPTLCRLPMPARADCNHGNLAAGRVSTAAGENSTLNGLPDATWAVSRQTVAPEACRLSYGQ